MAVEWTEPQMVFEISLQTMTHQWHFEKMQVDSFAQQLEPIVSVMMFAMFAHLTLPIDIVQTCDSTVIIKMLPLYIIIPTHRKIYIHRLHLLLPQTFILQWPVEKCRRLNTALQVI